MINRLTSLIKIFTTIFCIHISTILSAQQLPFNGTPIAVPGQIEAENFDEGGEDIAFHDIDISNNGGQYRDSAVDIENSSEGGYNVGWIEPGEWLEYTVDVASTGLFSFDVRVASESLGGTFHIEFDGTDVTGPINIEATGGWQTWVTLILDNIQLTAGQQVMRFVSESSGFNLNYINIVSVFIANPPTIEITSPLDNDEFFHGDNIQIKAAAADSDGTVLLVEFYADDQKIAQDSTAPFEFLWQQPEIGNYNLRAIATDNDSAKATSKKVDVSVNFPEYDYTVDFSEQDQFQNTAFTLTLSSTLNDASIKYTFDGSNPLNSSSAQTGIAPVQLNINPDMSTGGRGITPGVIVRAVVTKNSFQQSWVATKTYLFINEVKNQDTPGGNWPDSSINHQILYYSVNQDVVNDANYSNVIDDALLDIPSLSIVTDLDNLFKSDSGIYVNAQFHGKDWEREVSVELLNPDGTTGFQINAGLRIRGGWSRHPYFPKHSFRLFFREEYGENKLRYPLFGAEGVDEFKKMDLRTSQNYAWSNGYVAENTMNRDVFSRDLQAKMGQPYTRSRYYHLYINGLYWGLYQAQERPEANFAESYLGGNDNDYDVVKVDIGEDWSLYEIEATDGNLDAWKEVWDRSELGFASNENYFGLEGKNADGTLNPAAKKLVDIDNLIDYMLIIFYTGNFDAPVSKFRGEQSPNNFYAIYDRTKNDGFIFLAHDSEHTLLVNPFSPGVGLEEDRVNISPFVDRFEIFHPQWLHIKLSENPEYRLRFADRIYRHFFYDGAMRPETLAGLFTASANAINMAIIGESMRWGDLNRSKNNAWQPAVDLIVNEFFPYRGDIVLGQLFEAGLIPEIAPPIYKVNGSEITESTLQIIGETAIEIDSDGGSGSIFYTLDGTDPRLVGGETSPAAINASNNQIISINSTSKIMARMKSGLTWSPLHELIINSSENLSSLILSEIHYHPLDEGLNSGKLYEFLEFKNPDTVSMNLSLATFVNGIDYTFPSGTIVDGGEFIVIASNSVSFEQRYGFSPFGQFSGQLDNSGERLELANASGDTLISVRYNDKAPWPIEADGDGPSLTWTNETGNDDPNDALNWVASLNIHGSPARDELTTSLSESKNNVPSKFKLFQNYPNPFNPLTQIVFELPEHGKVILEVFNNLGQKIATLLDKPFSVGHYQVKFDAQYLPSGIYYYRINVNNFQQVKKMILLK